MNAGGGAWRECSDGSQMGITLYPRVIPTDKAKGSLLFLLHRLSQQCAHGAHGGAGRFAALAAALAAAGFALGWAGVAGCFFAAAGVALARYVVQAHGHADAFARYVHFHHFYLNNVAGFNHFARVFYEGVA